MAPDERQRCVVIALGIVIENAKEDGEFAANSGMELDIVVEPDWQFMGYDVVDFVGLSGLSNCGYQEDEKALRSEWGPKVNEHGLFSDLSDALAYRVVTNQRVIEHAPFFVYGIWVVGSSDKP